MEATKTTTWQERLAEERKNELEKLLRLKAFIDDPDTKLNAKEWNLLHKQYYNMRDFVQSLTDRCVYYGLIAAPNLDLNYNRD